MATQKATQAQLKRAVRAQALLAAPIEALKMSFETTQELVEMGVSTGHDFADTFGFRENLRSVSDGNRAEVLSTHDALLTLIADASFLE